MSGGSNIDMAKELAISIKENLGTNQIEIVANNNHNTRGHSSTVRKSKTSVTYQDGGFTSLYNLNAISTTMTR